MLICLALISSVDQVLDVQTSTEVLKESQCEWIPVTGETVTRWTVDKSPMYNKGLSEARGGDLPYRYASKKFQKVTLNNDLELVAHLGGEESTEDVDGDKLHRKICCN